MILYKSILRHRALSSLAALVGLLLPGLAAHELEASITLAAPVVVIRCAYGGSEPVVFAKVRVVTPDSPPLEFQTAVTDRRGHFSFVPEGPGDWRVIVDDEVGHRREMTINVPQSFQSNGASFTAPTSRLERALLGLSLLIGATGFLYGFKARRHPSRPAS